MAESNAAAHWLVHAAVRSGAAGAAGVTINARATPVEIWAAVARAAGLASDELAVRVAAQFHLPLAALDAAEPRAQALIPEKVARRHLVFPLRETDRQLAVAVWNPTDLDADQQIGFASGRTPKFEIATPAAIQDAIDGHYAPDRLVESLLDRVGSELGDDVRVLEETGPEVLAAQELEGAPVVRLTSLILADAVRERASDIHLEPGREGGNVRFRVDGVLRTHMPLPMAALNRVVYRIKIMGKLDIADRLRPQDGRTRVQVKQRTFDLRISTVPTREAEKAVIRLLDPNTSKRIDDLELPPHELARFRRLLAHRDGIVVVTGPTGSGKTTTLYAALRELATGKINIMTVEDPVEYELPGLTQIQVEPKRGVTFASSLRSILRQDPDVIFVGEIRDLETAEVAVQAALTGHLVLATLHTNDAVGAIARFVDLGLDRSKIAGTLRGAVAQRLLRRVCPDCGVRITGTLTPEEERLAGVYGARPVMRAVGCTKCGRTGYRGRLPVQEVLLASPTLDARISSGAAPAELLKAAIAGGLRPIRDVAVERALSGDTTLEEVERVLGGTDDAPVPGDAATHILVVDDDAVSRTLARAVLEKSGYRVTEAADGVAALDLLAAAPQFQLMVLDLEMPRLSGAEVLDRVRHSVATAGLPVVVLTGATGEETEVQMMDRGADDYVRKPIDPPRFVARIKATLRRAGG